MSFPKTLNELHASGYGFENHAQCKGCGREIEWWKTPKGKMMPMDPMPSGESAAVAHWATCRSAKDFRKDSDR